MKDRHRSYRVTQSAFAAWCDLGRQCTCRIKEESRRHQTQSSCPCPWAQSCRRQGHGPHAKWIHAFNSMVLFYFLSNCVVEELVRISAEIQTTSKKTSRVWFWAAAMVKIQNVLFRWWLLMIFKSLVTDIWYCYYDWHHVAKNVFGVTKFTISFFLSSFLHRAQ